MFCPKCGTENPETGKFCRSCGTDLSRVSKALNKKPSRDADIWGGDWSDMDWGASRKQKKSQPQNPEDILSAGVESVIIGFGFFIVSMVLFFTGVAGGLSW